MITLDQVQKLEKKVKDAVDLIHRLKSEKAVLEEKNLQNEMKILELEEAAAELNKDQNEIEDTIIGALSQLEKLESVDDAAPQGADENKEPEDESETSADFPASEDQKFVITESEEPADEVINSETEAAERSEPGSDEDNQSELQEEFTEDPQDGITAIEETVEEDEIPTVDSEFGEMPEDEIKKSNNSEVDLFEQSLDIF